MYHKCGNVTLDLYKYLVLLKRKIYIEKTICTQQNQPQLFEKWLYEGLQIIMGTIIRHIFIKYFVSNVLHLFY